MKGVILTDEKLKTLEKRFGPCVRRMGEWYTDGTFGYSWISMAVIDEAAESTGNPDLMRIVSHLEDESEQIARFVALLETFGQPLIERIIEVYRRDSLPQTSGTAVVKKAPGQEPKMAAAAAG